MDEVTIVQNPPWETLEILLKDEGLFVDEARTRKRKVQAQEFMYMHTKTVEKVNPWDGIARVDAFKHHMTRNYVYISTSDRDEKALVVRYNDHFNRGYFGEVKDEHRNN